LAHVGLEHEEKLIDHYRDQISPPNYYQAQFTDAELETIATETHPTRAKYGYPL
jgi:hypothetical protein